MSTYDEGHQRPGNKKEQRIFDRRKFGKALQKYITNKLKWRQKEFVKETLKISAPFSEWYDEQCNLDDATLSKIIQGDPKRNLGRNRDQPINLFWITVVFMIYGVFPTKSWLDKWLWQECHSDLVNDKGGVWLSTDSGKAWIERDAPLIVAEMGYVWPVVAAETNRFEVGSEQTSETQPLPQLTRASSATQGPISNHGAEGETDPNGFLSEEVLAGLEEAGLVGRGDVVHRVVIFEYTRRAE